MKDWEEIWWSIADGDKVQYDSLKGTGELEFYSIYDLHQKKIERLKNAQKNGRRK